MHLPKASANKVKQLPHSNKNCLMQVAYTILFCDFFMFY